MILHGKYKSDFFLAKSDNVNNNLTDEKLPAIKSLDNNQDLVACKPDKGNGVVVLTKKEYIFHNCKVALPQVSAFPLG